MVALCSAACGFLLSGAWHRFVAATVRVQPPVPPVPTDRVQPPAPNWAELPSGWSRDISKSVTIYATVVDGTAYWWVSRRGRTIVEGPSRSLELAKIEAEREARDLTAEREARDLTAEREARDLT